jgi:hypothetical protein
MHAKNLLLLIAFVFAAPVARAADPVQSAARSSLDAENPFTESARRETRAQEARADAEAERLDRAEQARNGLVSGLLWTGAIGGAVLLLLSAIVALPLGGC